MGRCVLVRRGEREDSKGFLNWRVRGEWDNSFSGLVVGLLSEAKRPSLISNQPAPASLCPPLPPNPGMTPARTLCLPRTPRSSDWSCSARTWSPVTTATTMAWWESWRPEEREWSPSLLVGAGCMSALGGCCEACWVLEELVLAGCCEHSCACPTPQPLLCLLPAIKATAVNLPFLLVPALTFPSPPFPSLPFLSLPFLSFPPGGLDFSSPVKKFFYDPMGSGKAFVNCVVSLTGFALVGGPARQDAPKAVEALKKVGGTRAWRGGRTFFGVLRAVLAGWSACHAPQQEAAACICHLACTFSRHTCTPGAAAWLLLPALLLISRLCFPLSPGACPPQLNVPYLVSLPLVFQTTEEWLDSELGVHPVQVALQVRACCTLCILRCVSWQRLRCNIASATLHIAHSCRLSRPYPDLPACHRFPAAGCPARAGWRH